MNIGKIFLIAVLLGLPLNVLSERRPDLIGEMDLDSDEDAGKGFSEKQFGSIELQKDEVKVDPYVQSENDAIEFIESIKTSAKNLATTGSTSAISIPNDLTLQHIANAYLFCSIKKGICPEYLQTLREADVINTIQNPGNKSCKTMNAFWNVWSMTNMQRKLDHQVKISQMAARTQFNKTILPHYVDEGCSDYLGQISEEVKTPDTLKKRYEVGGKIDKALNTVSGMLQFFKKKHINLAQSVLPR